MRLFDSHAHLACERFEPDFDGVLERMREAGVTGCMVMCDPGDLEPDHVRALEIVRQNPNFRLAAGIHPHNARNWSDEREKTLRGLLALPECTVLGEIGLDYHYDLSPRDTQREVFDQTPRAAYRAGKGRSGSPARFRPAPCTREAPAARAASFPARPTSCGRCGDGCPRQDGSWGSAAQSPGRARGRAPDRRGRTSPCIRSRPPRACAPARRQSPARSVRRRGGRGNRTVASHVLQRSPRGRVFPRGALFSRSPRRGRSPRPRR